jgi:hypothetical protein
VYIGIAMKVEWNYRLPELGTGTACICEGALCNTATSASSSFVVIAIAAATGSFLLFTARRLNWILLEV